MRIRNGIYHPTINKLVVDESIAIGCAFNLCNAFLEKFIFIIIPQEKDDIFRSIGEKLFTNINCTILDVRIILKDKMLPERFFTKLYKESLLTLLPTSKWLKENIGENIFDNIEQIISDDSEFGETGIPDFESIERSLKIGTTFEERYQFLIDEYFKPFCQFFTYGYNEKILNSYCTQFGLNPKKDIGDTSFLLSKLCDSAFPAFNSKMSSWTPEYSKYLVKNFKSNIENNKISRSASEDNMSNNAETVQSYVSLNK
jgi:hypothetical protein